MTVRVDYQHLRHVLPQGPISRADLVRALAELNVLLEGGPVPLDEDHLYLLLRDSLEDLAYHVVYAPAGERDLFVMLAATPVQPMRR